MKIQFLSKENRGLKILFLLAVILSFFGFGMTGCRYPEAVKEPVTTKVVIIHNNPCESCREEEKLQELFSELVPQNASGEFSLKVLYAYHGEGAELVEKAAGYFDVEKKDIIYPFVIAGDQYLMGSRQMEDELTSLLTAASKNQVTEILPERSESTADGDTKEMDADKEESWYLDAGAEVIHLLYFSTESCHNCENVQKFLDSLPQIVTVGGNTYSLTVTKLSVAKDNNIELFEALAQQYDIPESKRQVPLLLIGNHYLSGENQILSEAENLLADGVGAVYQAQLSANTKKQPWENVPVFLLKTLGVGFLNGFNPCALSLVLLFLSLIAAMPEGFTRYGLSFLIGKFLAYVLLGAAAASALSAIDFAGFGTARTVLKIFLVGFCLILAAGNFLDSYHAVRGEYGKIRVQLPGKLRKFNDGLVKKMVNPKNGKLLAVMIFLGSMAIACGEFFCTGQIYLASVLQWISQSEGSKIPLLAFVLYSAALCTPSFVIFCLVKKGRSIFSLTGESLKKMPLIKLCNGIIFIVFAVLALYYS
ncbi:MAG: hypothetical protein IJ390_04680 [Lachnospiraceae bacterium]|nr:hypothetical protein [Lachnospiraceae bacterium]